MKNECFLRSRVGPKARITASFLPPQKRSESLVASLQLAHVVPAVLTLQFVGCASRRQKLRYEARQTNVLATAAATQVVRAVAVSVISQRHGG